MLRAVGGRRVATMLAAVVTVITAAVLSVIPRFQFAFWWPEVEASLETTASLVALLTGLLAFARLRRRGHLTDLALACALGVIAVSNLFFAMVPALAGPAPSNALAHSQAITS